MKSVSNKTTFVWLGSLAVLNFIIVSVIFYLTQVTLFPKYADDGAFGIALILQAVIYVILVLSAITYSLFGKYGSSKLSYILKLTTLVICFIVALLPILMNMAYIIHAERDITYRNQSNVEQALLDAKNCSDYKAQLSSFPKDKVSIPTPPQNCL